jgi:hypothetical protein
MAFYFRGFKRREKLLPINHGVQRLLNQSI